MKFPIILMTLALMLSGCAETWKGAKKDSSKVWDETKQATSEVVQATKKSIHEATE